MWVWMLNYNVNLSELTREWSSEYCCEQPCTTVQKDALVYRIWVFKQKMCPIDMSKLKQVHGRY